MGPWDQASLKMDSTNSTEKTRGMRQIADQSYEDLKTTCHHLIRTYGQ